tara:strand:+ start:1992 stop:3071 length:1080 start_codon:yes stop_codon:yes gene_type:complete
MGEAKQEDFDEIDQMKYVSSNMSLDYIKHRYKKIKGTDLTSNGYKHPARELKDNTIANNSRLIKKMLDSNPKGKVPIYRRPDALNEWLDSSGFSDSTKRNYIQLAVEMTMYDQLFTQSTTGGLQSNLKTGLNPTIKELMLQVDALEKKIQDAKGKREVSAKKKEQQVGSSVVYDVIAGLRANNHDAEALMLDILMKYPYRAEVGTLKLLTELAQYRYLKKKGLKENYLVLGKRKIMVSRSDYKTSDQYGLIENDITDKGLKQRIREYVEKYDIKPRQPLFGYTDNQEVSKRLGYLTKKIAGVSLGPAAVVKIMLSDAPFKDLAEAADFLKEMSRIRGTSLSTLQDVYLHSKGLPPTPEQ